MRLCSARLGLTLRAREEGSLETSRNLSVYSPFPGDTLPRGHPLHPQRRCPAQRLPPGPKLALGTLGFYLHICLQLEHFLLTHLCPRNNQPGMWDYST